MTTLTRPPTLLWLIGLDHESGMRHGGNLRWFNLSRELLARGGKVYFGMNRGQESDLAARRRYLDELQRDGFISGHFVLDYHYPRWRGRVAALFGGHPRLLNRLLRAARTGATQAIEDLVRRHQVEVILVSDRSFLFLTESLGRRTPVLVDWVDSFVLYHRRAVARHFRRGEVRAGLAALRNLVTYSLQERYYGARAAANLVASPVDKRCLDELTRMPERTHSLLNGLSISPPVEPSAKLPMRLIFTGNMNFPPNHEAAVWFIDEVLPLIHRSRPEVVFTVAGRNPLPALIGRAGPSVQILGDVPDISTEIAASALYVAPLVSGGGFKNKVIEAISCGTFVVSTARGVEFLDSVLSELLLVADSPSAFAEHVVRFLQDPKPFEARLPTLQARIGSEYTWGHRAEQLIAWLPACRLRPQKPSGLR